MSFSDIQLNVRRPFRQGNTEQNERMRNWVAERIQGWSGEVIELFCGSGNFTRKLLDNPDLKVFAAEVGEGAVSALFCWQESRLAVFNVDLFQENKWSVLFKACPSPRYLFLDPPRVGFRQLRKFLARGVSVEEILYVSCDLHSFNLDAVDLGKMGYRLLDLKAVDQFPQTPHIEILSHWSRLKQQA
jgi:23S rRNA (uracil1939-C5)-methyltransferase